MSLRSVSGHDHPRTHHPHGTPGLWRSALAKIPRLGFLSDGSPRLREGLLSRPSGKGCASWVGWRARISSSSIDGPREG